LHPQNLIQTRDFTLKVNLKVTNWSKQWIFTITPHRHDLCQRRKLQLYVSLK